MIKKSSKVRELTLESGRSRKIHVHRRNSPLADRLSGCAEPFAKLRSAEKAEREAKYVALQQAYETGLESLDAKDELFKLAKARGLSANRGTSVFGLTLRLIPGNEKVNRREITLWAAALNLLHHKEVQIEDAARKLRELGGVRKCADAYRKLKKGKSEERSDPAEDADPWTQMKARGKVGELKDPKGVLARGRQVVAISRDKKGRVQVHCAVKASDRVGNQILKLMAAKGTRLPPPSAEKSDSDPSW